MNPAILRQETIEKFGYDPRGLALRSNRRVVFRCMVCGETREAPRHCDKTKCYECARVKPPSEVTVELLMDIYFSYSMQQGRPRKSTGALPIRTAQRLLSVLGHPTSTEQMKAACIAEIIRRPTSEIFAAFTYMVNKHRTLGRPYNSGNKYLLSDKVGHLEGLLAALGFSYERRRGTWAIEYGSFFINGEWIHIG